MSQTLALWVYSMMIMKKSGRERLVDQRKLGERREAKKEDTALLPLALASSK